MNKFGWFDLNVAFYLPNKIAERKRRVHSQLTALQLPTNAADNDKEHILR